MLQLQGNRGNPKAICISLTTLMLHLALWRHPKKSYIVQFAVRKMSGGVSYAAAISTPTGALRQPQIQATICSDPDLRSSFESQASKKYKTTPQRPGAGLRSKTSFRGWVSKGRDSKNQERGAVQEVQSYFAPRAEHQPNTGGTEEHVYVLTMKLEDSLSGPLDDLRKQYFPKKLNRTSAHLTLFHALPHSQIGVLEQSLSELSSSTRPFHVTTGGPFRMRRGVGVNVDAGYQEMKEIQGQLRSQWLSFLSEQDQGGFRPHWTVMNKVDDEADVQHALNEVRRDLSHNAKEGLAVGLELWKYDRGNWIWAQEYTFREDKMLSCTQAKGSTSGQASREPNKRPGLMKRGSSVADAWKSMTSRRKN